MLYDSLLAAAFDELGDEIDPLFDATNEAELLDAIDDRTWVLLSIGKRYAGSMHERTRAMYLPQKHLLRSRR